MGATRKVSSVLVVVVSVIKVGDTGIPDFFTEKE